MNLPFAPKNPLARAGAETAGAAADTRRLDAQLKAARAAEAAARVEAAALRERLAAFETGTAIVDMGRRLMSLAAINEDLRAAAERGSTLLAALGEAEQRSAILLRERDQLAAERDALERLLLAGENEAAAGDRLCNGCEAPAAGRCVLCIGGRAALLGQYRALAQRLGIRLIHHDGGQETSLSRLPELINAADAVLCPADCVSDDAYCQVERHCRRADKPCLMFKGAGVSGFAVALVRVAAGRAGIAGAVHVRQ